MENEQLSMKTQALITTILFVAGMALTALDTHAQNSNEFVVPLSDPAKRGKLRAHINYGSIMVKGTARKDILVRYKVADDKERRESSKNGLKRIGGGGIDLEVAESSNSIRISSGSWSQKLELELEVPSGMDLDVKTYNDGDLQVTNIQGETVLTNYNGDISAEGISGSVIATTYNGEIKVIFDKVTADTPMSFSTYNGDIDVSLPSSHKASLKLRTDRGDMYSDFDVSFKSTGPVQQKETKAGVYKVKVDDWKRGDINGGGPELTVKNYNGDIFIRKKN